MLFALVYSCVHLLLDIADVRLRLKNPEAELLLLRHELRVLRRQINRPQLSPADQVIVAAFHRLVSRPALGGLVEPATVLAWHRALVRMRWIAFGKRRVVGRPGLETSLRELILRMARENPGWGCVRIRGELLKVGHRVSATAIRNLLRREKLGPSPKRSGLSWRAFLRGQASAIVVSDFFSVDAVFLRRLYVLLYGVGDEADRLVRGDRPSGYSLLDSAEPEPGLATGPFADPLGDSRPRRQIPGTQRCRAPSPADERGQDPDRGSQSECAHGEADRIRSSRVPGLDLDHRTSTPRAGDGRMDRALQRRQTPAEPRLENSDRQIRCGPRRDSRALSRSPGRSTSGVHGFTGIGGWVIAVRPSVPYKPASYEWVCHTGW
jgi:hypothetical protein